MYKLLPLILLSGCQLYGAAGIHNTSFDSEYVEDGVIATIGASQELNDNFELYLEHSSMPFFSEKNNGRGGGFGVNQVGIKAKVKLY